MAIPAYFWEGVACVNHSLKVHLGNAIYTPTMLADVVFLSPLRYCCWLMYIWDQLALDLLTK